MAKIRAVGREIGAAICRILGVERGTLRRVDIALAPDALVATVITRVIADGEAQELVRTFEGVTWHERPPVEGGDAP